MAMWQGVPQLARARLGKVERYARQVFPPMYPEIVLDLLAKTGMNYDDHLWSKLTQVIHKSQQVRFEASKDHWRNLKYHKIILSKLIE